MAGKVFFSGSMSLDGFIAPASMEWLLATPVVTHEHRDLWERPGGTTFHFVDDGIETALDLAREAVRGRDVRIAGGGATILEYMNAGLVDEFSIALAPMLIGAGIRLFEGVDADRLALEPARAEPTHRVTHLTHAVRESRSYRRRS